MRLFNKITFSIITALVVNGCEKIPENSMIPSSETNSSSLNEQSSLIALNENSTTETTTTSSFNNTGTSTTSNNSVSDSEVTSTPTTDITAPVITINGANPLEIIQGKTFSDPGATALDDKDSVVNIITLGTVDVNTIGSYRMIYTAEDKAGHKTTAIRIVNVKSSDTVAPVITLSGANPLEIIQGNTFSDPGATATDNKDETVSVTSSGTVDINTVGSYTITYMAKDSAGNQATATRTVNVKSTDTVAPVITLNGANPFETIQGDNFSDPGATATDDRDGTVSVTSTGTVDINTVGTYTITYTAKDSAGNQATATRTVEVKPTEDIVWEVSNVTDFRQALENAAANGRNDTIKLSAGVYKTTSDGLGTFSFDDNEEYNLTIESAEGLTSKDVTLDGNTTQQVFNFNNTAKSTLIFKRVSIMNGQSLSHGGGVYSNQNIEIIDCNVSNNKIESGNGGGLYSRGSVTLRNSELSNNIISSYGNGGGFFAYDSSLIEYSKIYNNSKGGGFVADITIINNSIISNNVNLLGGGFIANKATIVNTSILNNQATGASLDTSKGGGFYVNDVTIQNSLISHNRSSARGGGFYATTSTILNSIISYNNSGEYYGGAFASTKTTLVNSLIYNNNNSSGVGGVYSGDSIIVNSNFLDNNGTAILSKGIFINNIFHNNINDIAFSGDGKFYNNYVNYIKIEENGHNVIKKNNLQFDSVGEPKLSADNKTLQADSPLIDKGLNPSSVTYQELIDNDNTYNQLLEYLKIDMVGNQRVYNSIIDIGAVEYGSSE